jgi:hypothetical protein
MPQRALLVRALELGRRKAHCSARISSASVQQTFQPR